MIWSGGIAFLFMFVLMQTQMKGQVLMACFCGFSGLDLVCVFCISVGAVLGAGFGGALDGGGGLCVGAKRGAIVSRAGAIFRDAGVADRLSDGGRAGGDFGVLLGIWVVVKFGGGVGVEGRFSGGLFGLLDSGGGGGNGRIWACGRYRFWRPWKISQWENMVHCFCGTSFIKSCSILTGSVLMVSARRWERRPTCVSTTMPTF